MADKISDTPEKRGAFLALNFFTQSLIGKWADCANKEQSVCRSTNKNNENSRREQVAGITTVNLRKTHLPKKVLTIKNCPDKSRQSSETHCFLVKEV